MLKPAKKFTHATEYRGTFTEEQLKHMLLEHVSAELGVAVRDPAVEVKVWRANSAVPAFEYTITVDHAKQTGTT